jgi:kynurenine formamidase
MTLLDPARIVDLTEPWSPASWPYPGHPKASEGILQTYPRDRINTWSIETSMHTGTHVDAPLHCSPTGADLASVGFDTLVRPGYVVDLTDVADDWHVVTPAEVEERLPGPLEPRDALILRYGWQRFGRGGPEEDQERFFNRHPGPGRDLVRWTIDRDLAWIGTDSASFEHPANINLRTSRPDLVPELEALQLEERFDEESWMLAHRELLSRGVLHVDQAGGDLASVPAERVTLAIFPWRYTGGEASICRVVAVLA